MAARQQRRETVSRHDFRWRARRRERVLQRMVDTRLRSPWGPENAALVARLAELGVPPWATGVKVDRYRGAGRGRWQVVATAPA